MWKFCLCTSLYSPLTVMSHIWCRICSSVVEFSILAPTRLNSNLFTLGEQVVLSLFQISGQFAHFLVLGSWVHKPCPVTVCCVRFYCWSFWFPHIGHARPVSRSPSFWSAIFSLGNSTICCISCTYCWSITSEVAMFPHMATPMLWFLIWLHQCHVLLIILARFCFVNMYCWYFPAVKISFDILLATPCIMTAIYICLLVHVARADYSSGSIAGVPSRTVPCKTVPPVLLHSNYCKVQNF